MVAVVFGTLGFLVGRTTGHHNGHRVMKWHGDGKNEFVIEKDFDGGDDVKVTVKIDTVMKDGKQIIIKEEKKVK